MGYKAVLNQSESPSRGGSLSTKINKKSSSEALAQEGFSSLERHLLPRKGLSCCGSSAQPSLLSRYFSPTRGSSSSSPPDSTLYNHPAVMHRHWPGLAPSRWPRSGVPQPHTRRPVPRSPALDTGTAGAEGALAATPRLANASPPHRGADVQFPFWPLLHTPQTHNGSCQRGALDTSPPALVSIHGCFSFPSFNFPSLCGHFNNIPSESTEFLREAKVFVQKTPMLFELRCS